ncbi:O-antigen ligase family protein [Chitinophagaceae bacterium MMS25-I14]
MANIRFLNRPAFSKSNMAVFLALCMIASFLFSRSILSISMILFGVNGIRDVHPRLWLKQRWWLMGLIWIGMYLISWFWTDNKHEWSVLTQVKLPFFLLPLAFGFLPAFTQRQLQVFTVSFCAIMMLGALYSASFLLRDAEFYINSYKYAKVLPTPAYNDHICFSAAVVLCMIWCCNFWPRLQGNAAKWFIIISVVLLGIYIHLLAAKTGLVTLYIFLLAYSIFFAVRKHMVLGIALLVLMLAGSMAAYRFIPTFRERVGYIRYSYIQLQEKNYSGDYGDIGRLMSYDISLRLIKEHPLTGVGAGDMLDDMKKGYDKWYPQVADEQRLLPHNQFLIIALGTGLLSLISFIAWLLASFLRVRKNRSSAFFIMTWLVLLVPLMVDPTLEIQLGVFVFLFFLLWQRHDMIVAGGQTA